VVLEKKKKKIVQERDDGAREGRTGICCIHFALNINIYQICTIKEKKRKKEKKQTEHEEKGK
jgi:hypothetical protein